MQVLIVDDVLERQENLTIALLRAGYQVTSTASAKVAEVCVQCAHVDLLIVAETIRAKRTHALALLAEYQNPLLATIMMTPRTEADVDELYELLPSVHCLVGANVSAELVSQLADASVKGGGAMACAATLPVFMRRRETVPQADKAALAALQHQELADAA